MLDVFQRVETLSYGRFGTVKLVRSSSSGKLFIVKDISLTYMSPSERQFAVAETTLLSKCRHKNILRCLSAQYKQDSCTLSIVIEYAPFFNLHLALETYKRQNVFIPEKQVLDWFVQVTLALQYIHSRKIQHGNLIARNIFLTAENWLKIGNFTISSIAKKQYLMGISSIGVPHEVSPEICKGEAYTSRSDIWGLGCVLFQLVAFEHPFEREKEFEFYELVKNIKLGNRKSLPGHCGHLSKCLVDNLLSVRPENRLTADEILSIRSLQPNVNSYLDAAREMDILQSPIIYPRKRRRFKNSAPKLNFTCKCGPDRMKNFSNCSSSDKPNFIEEDKPKLLRKMQDATYTQIYGPSDRVSHYLLPGTVNVPASLFKWRENAVIKSSSSDSALSTASSSPGSSEPDCSASCSGHPIASSPFSNNGSSGACVGCDFQKSDAALTPILREDENSVWAWELPDEKNHPPNDCPLNVLWMNRIRNSEYADNNKRLVLEQKLKTMLGIEKFCKIYNEFSRAWEEETPLPTVSDLSPKEQLAIPLVMQLIQEDIVHRMLQ